MANNKMTGSTTRRGWARRLFLTSSVLALLIGQGGRDAALADQLGLSIPAQPLGAALDEFIEKTGIQLFYTRKDVARFESRGVSGAVSAEQAIAELLNGTGLSYIFEEENLIVIRRAAEAAARDGSIRVNSNTHHFDNGDQFAQVSEARRQTRARDIGGTQLASLDDDDFGADADMEEMIVTGSQIRGAAPESSPIFVFDREDIQNSGVSTAQQFIQLLPQNFGGGSNEAFTGLPNDSSAQFNETFGSSVNLRGLGSDSTLVLLNGHRLAPASGIGDFVDISMIPASAIERVDVLTDGASSIYGGDAVAGVVNFVLRDDYEGVETAFRYGTVTQGDVDEYRASIAGGTSWDSGNALIVYEYFNREALSAGDREFGQGAVLPNDLLPSQERHGVVGSVTQSLGSRLRLAADLLYATRDSQQNFTNIAGTSFLSKPSTENLNIATTLSWAVFSDWIVDISGNYSNVTSDFEREERSADDPSVIDDVATRTSESDLWSVDVKASGSVFRLPGGEVKLAAGAHYRQEDFDNPDGPFARQADRDVYAFFAEAFIPVVGPDNSFPGMERFEISASGRIEDYSDFGSTANPKVGVLWSPIKGLGLRGSYSTSFNPPPLGQVGASDFTASLFPTSFLNAVLGLTPADPSIANVVELVVGGTDNDLDAENSRAFTTGLDYEFQKGSHNFTLNFTYFDIEFENRINSTPIPGNGLTFDAPNIAFDSPEVFPEGTVIFSPSIEQINEVINNLELPIGNPFALDPLDTEIINNVSIVTNLSRTEVRGFDVNLNYTLESDIGQISFGVDATILKDLNQQGTVATPVVDQLDTLFNPVSVRLRGRAGYAYEGFVSNIYVNYTDNYRVDSGPSADRIDSWTTVDLTLSYSTEQKFDHFLTNDVVLQISAFNIFNEDPPSTPGAPTIGIFGYDPTNASPLGRFVSFEIKKAF